MKQKEDDRNKNRDEARPSDDRTTKSEKSDIRKDIAAIGRVSGLDALLKVLHQMTGMGFVVVARVTEDAWTACAVLDTIEFGLGVGGELAVTTTLCNEVRGHLEPIVIENAATDPAYCDHPTPKMYGIESYIAVPIIRQGNRFFGTLCAVDRDPHALSGSTILPTFKLFADLIAAQLDWEESVSRLEESEQRYKAFIENSSEGIWRFELTSPIPIDLPTEKQIDLIFERGYLAECNDAFAKQYGYRSSWELTGSRLADLLLPDDPKNLEFLAAFIESGYQLTDAESHEQSAAGNDLYILNNFVGHVENDLLMRAWGSQRDVTNTRIQTLAREHLAAIVESSDDAIISKDLNGIITSWNKGAENILGFTADEVIGLPITFVMPDERKGEGAEILRRVASGERVEHFETERLHKEGRLIPLSLTVSPIKDETGTIVGASKIARDISEVRKARSIIDKYRLMSLQARDIILFLEPGSGKILEANEAAAAAYGYSRDEILDLKIEDLRAPETIEQFDDQYDQAERSGIQFETVHLRRDGTHFPVEVSAIGSDVAGDRVIVSIVRDITERRRNEEALLQNERLLRLSMRSSRMGFWELDLASEAVIWSRELEEIFGLPEGSFRGTEEHFYELMHEEDRENVLSEVETAIIEKRPYATEFRFYYADGTIRWMEGRGEAVYTQNGLPVRLYGTGIDITERRKLQESLLESEGRFRGLMEQAPFSIQLFDPTGRSVGANGAWEELWGVTLDQIPDYNILSDPQLETKGIAHLIRSAFAGNVVELPPIQYDPNETIPERSRHSDPRRWVSAVAYPLTGPDGEIREVALVHQDITERRIAEEALRLSEERLDLAVSAHRIGIFDWYVQTGDIIWSEQEHDNFGVGKSEFKGTIEDWTKRVVPEDLEPMRNLITDAMARQEERLDFGFRIKRPEGEIRHIEGSARFLYAADGTPERMVGTNVDITERKDAEERERRLMSETVAATAKFRTIFDQSSIFAGIMSIDGIITEANRSCTEFCGYEASEVLGKEFWETPWWRNSEDVKSRIRAGAMQAAQGIAYSETLPYWWADGSERITEFALYPIRDDLGNVIYLYPTGIDITERQIAERAIRESEARFHHVADAAPVLIWVADTSKDYIWFNKPWLDFTGRPMEDEIANGWTHHLHPDDRGRWLETYESAFDTQRPFSIEYRMLRHDGEYRWMLDNGSPRFDSNGEFLGFIGSCIDIGDRKQAELSLLESEERFSKAFNASPLSLTISSLTDGRLIEVNNTFVEVTGYSREEAIGKTTADLGLWVETDDRDAEMDKVRQAGRLGNAEYRFRTRAGNVLTGLLAAERIDIGGEPFALTVIQDITERKRAEDKIRENEAILRAYYNSSPLLMGIVELGDDDDLVTRIYDNPATEAFFGIAPGRPDQTSIGWLASSTEARRLWILNYRKSEKDARPVHFEFEQSAGVGKRWLSVTVSCIGLADNGRTRFAYVAEDTTEKKLVQEALIRTERKAVEEYQTLLQRIVPLGETLGTAPDLDTIYRGLLGFVKSSMPCSSFFVSFYEPDTHMRTAAFAWGGDSEVDISLLPPIRLKDDGGPNSQAVFRRKPAIVNQYMEHMRSRDFVVVTDDGIEPKASLAVPMIVNDRVIGTIEVQAYEDQAFQTEHVVALEMVANLAAVAIENVRLIQVEAQARGEAEMANRAKDEFLSVLSHELRTPLNAMLGWVRMLRSDVLDKENVAKALEVIERNTRLQGSLIEDLLDVSRIISGKMRIETQPVDLIGAVATISETVRPLALAKDVLYHCESDLGNLILQADPVRLQQVISNLLQNAIKFTPAGGAVTATITRRKNRAVLSVSDTGVGIDPEFLPYIFDRFRQADASTKRHYAGLGLGLTIVRTIVNLHGGEIMVESDGCDRGSVFTVTLPLAEETNRIPEEALAELAAPGKILEGVRILMVDDDTESLVPMRLYLERERASVENATSAVEALEKLSHGNYDLLISDIGMPGTDGYELIQSIRRSGNGSASIPAIALTADASEDDCRQVLDAGFQMHLAKPVDFGELLKIIKRLI